MLYIYNFDIPKNVEALNIYKLGMGLRKKFVYYLSRIANKTLCKM